jgi:CRISPR-associated endonuclease/helicase Cas3
LITSATRPFFAHSVSGEPEEKWEPLRDHLTAVSLSSARAAGKFGFAEAGAASGLLHDLGKYQPDFQDHIRGRPRKVDHAAHGAVVAREKFGILGALIAHGIAGHHAGLDDELFDKERMAKESAAVEASARADGIEAPKSLPAPRLQPSENRGFQCAFLTRMLFSCLVDADYTETERFYVEAEKRPTPPRGATASIVELADTLAAFLRGKQAKAKPTDVNRHRAAILEKVLSHTGDLPGVFKLTVPTGGGKTLASLSFALEHARKHGLDRVIVVIPFTSIIEQTAEVYRGALAPFGDAVIEHHSGFDEDKVSGKEARDKLSLAMENWDARIVVTTAVQFFESLFSNRPSRCRKLHNLARSVIVLDEVQTLPLAFLHPCVAALQELRRNYGTSLVLCTATQPALDAPGFPKGLGDGIELAPDPPRLFRDLRRVRVESAGKLKDGEIVDRIADAERVLCIVNLKDHARDLFELMRTLPGATHLSTTMCAAHRRQVLDRVRADLIAKRPCRVVSTSLIEAGVDVDFPLVLRAATGLDSIAQAAGRCNREGLRTAEDSFTLVFETTGRDEPGYVRPLSEAARELMRIRPAEDWLQPETINEYFRILYWKNGNAALDKHGVLALCEDGLANKMNFRFREIADSVKLIDDWTQPVIVPFNDEAKALLGELESFNPVHSTGALARRLQRYIVGVPAAERRRMVLAGAAREIWPDRYGDQFVRLDNLDIYSDQIGLDWRDPAQRRVDGLIV